MKMGEILGRREKKGQKLFTFPYWRVKHYFTLKFVIFARYIVYSCLVTILFLGFIGEFCANVEEPSTLSLSSCV